MPRYAPTSGRTVVTWRCQRPGMGETAWVPGWPRPWEAGGGSSGRDAHLAHAVVRQLDVAVGVKEDIVQLQVPVDNPSLV